MCPNHRVPLQRPRRRYQSFISRPVRLVLLLLLYRVDLQNIGKRESLSASPTPANFELAKDEKNETQAEDGNLEQISAADYDPCLDRREDEQKRVLGAQDGHSNVIEMIEEEEEEEDDVDDMFAALTSEKKIKKVKKFVVGVFPSCWKYRN